MRKKAATCIPSLMLSVAAAGLFLPPAAPGSDPPTQIPEPMPEIWPEFIAEMHRAEVPSEVVPLYAGQVEAESSWRPYAESFAGAVGPAQFMAPTWRSVIARTDPPCTGKPRTDPPCAFRSQVWLMRENETRRRPQFLGQDHRRAAFSDYNGGPSALNRERALCIRHPGCSPIRWHGHVARMRSRSEAAWRENRAYPDRIERFSEHYRWPSSR